MSEIETWKPEHPDYRELQRLIAQIREGTNKQALEAVDELRKKKWILDGSLALYGADLRNANLKGADLSHISLWGADLSGAILSNANLRHAVLEQTNLSEADLSNADLRDSDQVDTNLKGANLVEADLSNTDLFADMSKANLSGADLFGSVLRGVSLVSACLAGADLNLTILQDVDLTNADLSNTALGYTVFANVGLLGAKGLDDVDHSGPSNIDLQTLASVHGQLPLKFLKGVGLPDALIRNVHRLFDTSVRFCKAFISYSHADKGFVDRLYNELQLQGVRCWRDDKDMRIGDKIYDSVNKAIRGCDKVILICSENSLKSRWVKREFETMLQKEEDHEKTHGEFEPLLLPLDVDGYVFQEAANDYMVTEIKSRLAADFTNWKDHDAFEASFEKLVKALKVHRPADPEPKLGRDDG